MSPPHRIPPLTPTENRLLSAFLIYRFDMVTLAEREKLGAADLLAFARSPAVQAHLTELRRFADQAFHLRSLESRTKAIDLLEDVARNTTDLVEKRRAAATILRGLNPPGGVPHRTVPRASKPSNSPRLHSPHRQAWTPVSDATDHQDNTHPLDTNTPSSLPASPLPASPSPSSSPHSPLITPHSPPPLATPSPEISDDALAQLTLGILRKPKDPRNLSTLRAFCTPKTLLAGIQIPTDPQAFNHRAADILLNHNAPNLDSTLLSRLPSPPSQPHAECLLPNASSSSFLLTTRHFNRPNRHLTLTLSRNSPTEPWLIASLNPDTS